MQLEIEKVLVIWSGHITKDDMISLTAEDSNDYPFTRLETDYGIIVTLPSDTLLPPRNNSEAFILNTTTPKWCNNFSDEFIEILRIAQENNCYYINFDCDGPMVDGLTVFEW